MYFHFRWLALHPMNVPHNTCREARHHQGRSHLLSLFLKGDTKRYAQKWTDTDEKHWKTIGNGKLTKRNRHLMRFIEDLDICFNVGTRLVWWYPIVASFYFLIEYLGVGGSLYCEKFFQIVFFQFVLFLFSHVLVFFFKYIFSEMFFFSVFSLFYFYFSQMHFLHFFQIIRCLIKPLWKNSIHGTLLCTPTVGVEKKTCLNLSLGKAGPLL